MLPGGNSQTGNMKQRPCSKGDGQILCFQQSFVQKIHPFGRGKLRFFHAKRQGLCGAPQVPAPNTQENRRFTPPFSACQRNDLQHTHRSEIPCPFYMIEFIIAWFYGLSRETCGDFCRTVSERAKTAFPRPKTGICGFFFCEEHDILGVMKRERWSA